MLREPFPWGPASLKIAPMLDSPADVCIEVGGKKIYAHSKLLCDESAVWTALLSGVWKESCEGDAPEASSAGSKRVSLVKITEYSYEVVRAAIFWIMTDEIEFDLDEHPITLNKAYQLPTPVPAFDVYRFAHFYDMSNLASLAVDTMKRNFKPSTIMGQLFDDGVGQYPQVEQAMVDFLVAHWDEVQAEAEYNRILQEMLDNTASTSAHETEVMAKLLMKRKKFAEAPHEYSAAHTEVVPAKEEECEPTPLPKKASRT